MSCRGIRLLCPLLILLLMVAGCAARRERPTPVKATAVMVAVPPPALVDDADMDSLNAAIDASIRYYQRAGGRGSYCFKDQCRQPKEMIAGLRLFRDIMNESGSKDKKSAKIRDAFEFYQAAGQDGYGTVIFTGYYEPILDGSLEKTDRFRYPIYRTPEETVSIRLGSFNPKYGKDTLIGRIKGNSVVPHYSRKEIDSNGSLAGRDLELAWVDDPVSLFIMHIQGSGRIRLPDGRILRVNYDQANGKPFRGLTNYMVSKGFLSENEKSYERMKTYLQEHPESRDDIMNYNESYVFFRLVDQGPLGSLGFPVIAERSIATDPDIFPKGALAFVKLRKPLFTRDGHIEKWIPSSRFVFSHDAGGAIKGPGRVDIFCGTGGDAERLAGSLTERGTLFFLVPRLR